MPRPSPRVKRQALQPATITIASRPLLRAQDALLAAWDKADMGFALSLVSPPYAPDTRTNWQAGDLLDFDPLVDSPQHFPVLDSHLRTRNFNRSELLTAALEPYATMPGGLRGLPFFLSEPGFYANHAKLSQLGVVAPPRWTWRGMQDALTVALRRSPPGDQAPLIAGVDVNWVDVRIWGAFVLGLGGTLVADGKVDFSGAVEATKTFIAFVRRYRWNPPTAKPWFEFKGFAGGAAQALFAFLPPWTASLIGLPADSVSPAFSLPTSLYPLLPVRDVVPTWSSYGLVVSPYCENVDRAVETMLWLYRPEQQLAIASAGFPPVVDSPGLLRRWTELAGGLRSGVPRFTYSGATDIPDLFPHVPLGASQVGVYNAGVGSALQKMYHGANVARALTEAQAVITESMKAVEKIFRSPS